MLAWIKGDFSDRCVFLEFLSQSDFPNNPAATATEASGGILHSGTAYDQGC